MNQSTYYSAVTSLFLAVGIIAGLRWLHPATVSLGIFSLLFLISWAALALVVLVTQKQRE